MESADVSERTINVCQSVYQGRSERFEGGGERDGGKQSHILDTFAQQIRHPEGERSVIFSLFDDER